MQRNRSNTIEISPEANVKMEGARQALLALRKTFQHWVMIGDAIGALRDRANELGGRKTFHRLLEQQGLGTFVKSKAVTSRLEKIMAQLPEVEKWHRALTEKQQIEWSSPGSIINHCPVFAKTKESRAQGRIKPAPNTVTMQAKEIERLEARIQELEEESEGKTLTIEQHFDALIEALQDEPLETTLKRIKSFTRKLSEVMIERHPDLVKKAKPPKAAKSKLITPAKGGGHILKIPL